MTGKGAIKRRRQKLIRMQVQPIPPCAKTRDGIHRDQPDSDKCRKCPHHHCRACGICMRCRRMLGGACFQVGLDRVPFEAPTHTGGWRPGWVIAKEKAKIRQALAAREQM